MKAVFSLIIASTTIIFLAGPCHALDTFLGPGILECNSGQCEFSGRAGMFGGCTDPCHTRTSRHSFDFSFKDVGDVTGLQSYRGKQCYYKYAKNINSYYPDQYIEIGKGCTAKCNGCEFAPTILFRGPTQIDCNNGRCTNYTTDDLNCGSGIEAASEAYGSFQIPHHDGDQVYSLYGFEGITNVGSTPIQIPNQCSLDCSGCRRYVKKQTRRLGSGEDKI